MVIFVAHGLGLAAVGISAGAVLGTVLGLNISRVTTFVANAPGVKLFDTSVNLISEFPSGLQWSDVGAEVRASLLLSLLGTLYHAWRARRIRTPETLS